MSKEIITRLSRDKFYIRNENGKISFKQSFEALFSYTNRKQQSLLYVQKIHEFLYLYRNAKRFPLWKNPKNSSRLFLLKDYVELQLMKRYSSLRKDKMRGLK